MPVVEFVCGEFRNSILDTYSFDLRDPIINTDDLVNRLLMSNSSALLLSLLTHMELRCNRSPAPLQCFSHCMHSCCYCWFLLNFLLLLIVSIQSIGLINIMLVMASNSESYIN